MFHIHIISRDDKALVFHPDSYATFRCNSISGRVLEDHFTKGLDVETIARNHLLHPDNVRTLIKNLSERLPQHTLPRKKPYQIIEIKVNVSHTCNLTCAYCYAASGTYGRKAQLMSRHTAVSVVQFFLKNFANFDGYLARVVFFGGEPFLNPEAIETVCDFCERSPEMVRKPVFGVITNGTILTERLIRIIKDYHLTVTVSIDGPQEIHNSLRVYPDGRGSFDEIVSNVNSLKQLGVPVHYEATYTRVHQAHQLTMQGLAHYLESTHGFSSGVIVPAVIPEGGSVDLEPALGDGLDDVDCLTSGDISRETVYIPLYSFIMGEKLKYLCPIGVTHFCVAANGDIYPCQLFLGDDRFCLGNVHGLCLLQESAQYLRTMDMLSVYCKERNDTCGPCWAKNLCKGCPGNMYLKSHEVKIPNSFCQNSKRFLEELLWKLAELRSDHGKWDALVQRIRDKAYG